MKETTKELKYIDVYPDRAGKLAQKLHQKKDEIELLRKSYVHKDNPVEVNEDERSVVAVVSTEDKDRDGQVVKIDGVDLADYVRNPVLMWSHRYTEPPIGTMMWHRKEKGRLLMKFRFAKTDFASQIYQLYKDRILRAFSIGFVPVDYDKENEIFNKISILEVSSVPVPANQNALVTEAYRKGIIRSDKLIKDFEIEVSDFQPEPADDELIGDVTEALITKQMTDAKVDEAIEEAKVRLEVTEDEEVIEGEQKRGFYNASGDDSEADAEYWSGDHYPLLEEDKDVSSDEDVSPDGEDEEEDETEEDLEVVTKPETTDNYHRIPVSEGHSGHKIRTMTISAEKGIKALYCVDCKKIITYLFSTDSWSMAEAQAWVNDHKKLLDRYEQMLASKEDKEDEEDKEIVDIEEEDKDKSIELDSEDECGCESIELDLEDDEVEEMDIIEIAEAKAGEDVLTPDGVMVCQCVECGAKVPAEEGGKCPKCPKCGGKMKPVEQKDDEKDIEIEEIEGIEEEIEIEEKQVYQCECIECGYKMESEEHCRDLECPKCGGQMRRVERPGPGKDVEDAKELKPEYLEKVISLVKSQYEKLIDEKDARIAELVETVAVLAKEGRIIPKEGRVLSTKNRTLIREILDKWAELKVPLEELYHATEPPSKEEEKNDDVIEIDMEKAVEKAEEEGDDSFIEGVTKEDIEKILKEVLTAENIKKIVDEQNKLTVARLKGKVL